MEKKSSACPRVAVIGAGAAGAMAARLLADRGHEVCVFEKSRGVGGRMATRRSHGLAFDHGAQYLTLRDPRLAGLRDAWLRSGVLAPWQPAPDPAQARWVAVPGMNALAAHLLTGIEVVCQAQVSALARTASGWRLHGSKGVLGVGFDALIVAIPAPQAKVLLAPQPAWDEALAAVTMAPCWAVMLAGAPRMPDLPAGYLEVRRDATAAAAEAVSALSWLAHDGSKPGRAAGADTWVLHASEHWSSAHLQAEPDAVAAELWRAAAACLQVPASPPPAHLVAHRWRHARVHTALGAASLWDARLGLGLCGDWCLGARVEAALLSGADIAGKLTAGL